MVNLLDREVVGVYNSVAQAMQDLETPRRFWRKGVEPGTFVFQHFQIGPAE